MYPLFVVLAGCVVSGFFQRRGLKEMQPEAKAAWKDSYAQSRGVDVLTV
jgi:hypothetical protein